MMEYRVQKKNQKLKTSMEETPTRKKDYIKKWNRARKL